MRRENGNVAVFPNFERSDHLVHAKLFGRIQRHHLERLIGTHVSVAHADAGLLIQATDALVGIGVHGYDHAALGHQRHVVRNRVIGLDLVGPHVGEGGRHGAVPNHLIGDLVTLEHMLKRVHLESEVVGHADQHQDFVGAITVRVHLEIAMQDVDQGLEPEVATRRERVGIGLERRAVLIPLLIVFLCPREPVAHGEVHAHPRHRKPALIGRSGGTRARDVFTQRELHDSERALEIHRIHGRTPTHLDDSRLTADRVRAPVEEERRRHTTCQRAIDHGIVVLHLHDDFWCDRLAPLVDAALESRMRVRVDNAGHDELARTVDHAKSGGDRHVRANGGDLATAHDDGAILDIAVGNGDDRRVADGDVLRRERDRGGYCRECRGEWAEGPGRAGERGEHAHGRVRG